MAVVKYIGGPPMAVPEHMSVESRASMGEEMTPVKAVQRELCDGFLHLFNPGEEIKVTCKCPDLHHIRQFLNSDAFKVQLTVAERVKLGLEKVKDQETKRAPEESEPSRPRVKTPSEVPSEESKRES